MENLVINGSKNLITKFRPYLFIELLKTNGEDIINFFKENDYKIYLKGLEAFILPNESKVSFSGLKKL